MGAGTDGSRGEGEGADRGAHGSDDSRRLATATDMAARGAHRRHLQAAATPRARGQGAPRRLGRRGGGGSGLHPNRPEALIRATAARPALAATGHGPQAGAGQQAEPSPLPLSPMQFCRKVSRTLSIYILDYPVVRIFAALDRSVLASRLDITLQYIAFIIYDINAYF